MGATSETTEILTEIEDGNHDRVDRLSSMVYDELRALAQNMLRHERLNHTLQPTALVHEAFLRLVDQHRVNWRGKSHFLAVGAQAMRRILVDHARAKRRQKREGDRQRVILTDDLLLSRTSDDDVIAVDEALQKLEAANPLHARIVELRFFSGMSIREVSEVLGLSVRTVERHWTAIRAWLRREFSEESDE